MTSGYHKHHVGVVAGELLVEPVGGEVPRPPPNEVPRRHGEGEEEDRRGGQTRVV